LTESDDDFWASLRTGEQHGAIRPRAAASAAEPGDGGLGGGAGTTPAAGPGGGAPTGTTELDTPQLNGDRAAGRPSSGRRGGGRRGARRRADEEEPRRRLSFLRELPFLIVIALVLALLIKAFLVQAFYIPSGSMENTLQVQDRVLVNKLIYDIRAPHRGEIIVFKGPPDWAAEVPVSAPSNPILRFFSDIGSFLGVSSPDQKDFIKRVIGVPGDVVHCCNAKGELTINGTAVNESYVDNCLPNRDPCTADRFPASAQPFTVKVPPGHLWVMGDHRIDSQDSRYYYENHTASDGFVPISDVIGRAFAVVWPPSQWRTLPVPGTFDQKGLQADSAGGLPVIDVPLGLVSSAPYAAGLVGALPIVGLRRWWRRRHPPRRRLRTAARRALRRLLRRSGAPGRS
jgi:signal peptidase I